MVTFASGKYSIGICARCHSKVPYQELREDGNIPKLYVCADDGCYDELDPFKKPSRQADPISLDHPRPDVPLIPPTVLIDQSGFPLLDQDGNYLST